MEKQTDRKRKRNGKKDGKVKRTEDGKGGQNREREVKRVKGFLEKRQRKKRGRGIGRRIERE